MHKNKKLRISYYADIMYRPQDIDALKAGLETDQVPVVNRICNWEPDWFRKCKLVSLKGNRLFADLKVDNRTSWTENLQVQVAIFTDKENRTSASF